MGSLLYELSFSRKLIRIENILRMTNTLLLLLRFILLTLHSGIDCFLNDTPMILFIRIL